MNEEVLVLEKHLEELLAKDSEKELIIKKYQELADCYLAEGKVEQAISFAEKALETAKISENSIDEVQPRFFMAEMTNKLHYYEKSSEEYKWLIEYAENIEDYKLLMGYLLAIANIYWYWGKYDEARAYFLRCKDLSDKHKDEEIRGKVLAGLGLVEWKTGDYEKALQNYNKALKIQKKCGNESEIARILNYSAIVQKRIGKFQLSMRNFKKALKIQKNLADKESMSKLYNNIGNLYLLQGNSRQALEQYFDSIKLSEELGNMRSLASTRNNVGLIYYRMEKFEDASRFLADALAIKRKLGDEVDVAHTLNNLGLSYMKSEEFTKADECIREALSFEERAGDKGGMAVSYSFLGHAALAQDDLHQAKNYMEQSRLLYEDIGDINGITASLITESNISIQMENYSHAEEYLLKGLKIAEDAGIDVMISDCYNGLSILYKTMEDYKSAYEYQIKYLDLHDKLIDQENLNKIHEMQAKYKHEQQEKEAEIYRLKNVELHKANKELHDLKEDLERRIEKSIEDNRKKDSLLVAQSRQAAMGEMIGFIAHQWRQPLNAVGVIAQNILDSYIYDDITEEKLTKDTDNIMQQLRFMSDTISDFRNFFKPDREKVEFKINEVIMRIVSFIGKSFSNNNINLELDLNDDCTAFGFPNEYAQVVLNILNNAREAFRTCKDKKDKIVRIAGDIRDGKYIVSIFDNAENIDEKDLPHIFEPYFTTKTYADGTGLGLYMSRTIIEDHMNGSIVAENIKDGVQFTIIV